MRSLKACVLVLALFAGACTRLETGESADTKPKPPPAKPAASAAEEAAKLELQRLEGEWIAVDVEHDGDQLTNAESLKWVIRNGRYGVYLNQQKHETWTLKVDPSRQPPTIEARLVIDQTRRRVAGIYQLDGDKLQVCYDLTGRDFPTEFSAPKGARRVYYVFQRE